MIKVTFYQNPEDTIMRCVFEGHAEYADKGQDIICSAVSILFINTVNSVETYTDDPFSLDEDRKKNRYDFSFQKSPSKESQLLMNSLLLGLNTIRDQYGSKFLKITLKEVQ